MTQFAIQWILSLNRLSHHWGQVQSLLRVEPTPKRIEMIEGERHGQPNHLYVTENQIAHQILDSAYRIHSKLGPELFESVYESRA
jgi:hypothetical protein